MPANQVTCLSDAEIRAVHDAIRLGDALPQVTIVRALAREIDRIDASVH